MTPKHVTEQASSSFSSHGFATSDLGYRLLSTYIILWATWFLWTQTVGRLNNGLHLYTTLVFDALIGFGLWKSVWSNSFSPVARGTPEEAPEIEPRRGKPRLNSFFFKVRLTIRDVYFVLKDYYCQNKILFLLGSALVFVTFLNSLFLLPMDWDGRDYHLPPIVEFLQLGRWSFSKNYYFAAQTYPKGAGTLYLWWLIHVKSFVGLRGVLLVNFVHFTLGCIAIRQLFGRSIWYLLMWLSIPLIIRQASAAYSDMPGVVLLLIYCYFSKHQFSAFAKQGQRTAIQTTTANSHRVESAGASYDLKQRHMNDKNVALAIITLGLFSSLKFTNLVMAAYVLALQTIMLLLIFKADLKHVLRRVAIVVTLSGFSIALFSGFKYIENYIYKKNPFYPFQCRVLGVDLCQGSIDPNSHVLEPILDFSLSDPLWRRLSHGHLPTRAEVIAGFDPYHGGFGFIAIIVLFVLLFVGICKKFLLLPGAVNHIRRIGASRAFISYCVQLQPALCNSKFSNCLISIAMPIATLLVSDFFIGALWYSRFHLGTASALALSAAYLMQRLRDQHQHQDIQQYQPDATILRSGVQSQNRNLYASATRQDSRHHLIYLLFCILCGLQITWLIPHRVWFLGLQSPSISGLSKNIVSIFRAGTPATATHPADQQAITLYPTSGQVYILKENALRPVLPAYGRMLDNVVGWKKTRRLNIEGYSSQKH